MKRLLLAVVGVLALAASTAIAADMPGGRPMPRTPTYVPFFTWNGFYVGLNAGYAFGQSEWTDKGTQATTGNFDVSGGMFGGTAGYNVQFGGWVFGLEGDLGWASVKGATTNCFTTCETKNEWLGTLRARSGYAFDRFLPYVTGGFAFGGVRGSVLGFGSFSETQTGWSAGAGIEYAFVDNWTAKIEYLYADLGKATCNAACSGGNPFDVNYTTSIVRGGINYKF